MSNLPSTELRTLVVAAHPDDEVIGLGAVLGRIRDLMIVHVTDGAPIDLRDALSNGLTSREQYASKRRTELECALEVGGVRADLRSLDIIDQDAARELPAVIAGIRRLIDEFRPRIVWTHSYEGGHPDHDACAVAVHAIARVLCVRIAEFTSYHAGPEGIVTAEFLPSNEPVVTRELDAEERERKQRMLACFTTQRETLSQFRTDVERYRWAPAYNFSRPPHEGRVYYENFPWGMTSANFVSLAQDQLQ